MSRDGQENILVTVIEKVDLATELWFYSQEMDFVAFLTVHSLMISLSNNFSEDKLKALYISGKKQTLLEKSISSQ